MKDFLVESSKYDPKSPILSFDTFAFMKHPMWFIVFELLLNTLRTYSKVFYSIKDINLSGLNLRSDPEPKYLA